MCGGGGPDRIICQAFDDACTVAFYFALFTLLYHQHVFDEEGEPTLRSVYQFFVDQVRGYRSDI